MLRLHKGMNMGNKIDSTDDSIVVSGDVKNLTIGAARVKNQTAVAYRLARKKDGSIILQGCFQWQEGWDKSGHDWEEIPIVDLAT